MSEQSVVGVFESLAQSKSALAALTQHGVARRHVALISRELDSKQEVHGYVAGGDTDTIFSVEFAMLGAGVGLVLGAVGIAFVRYVGALAELNFFTCAAMLLVGAAAGFMVGAIVGAMSGRGVKEARVERYDEQLRAGRSLIVAHGNAAEMHEAEAVLKECGSIETHLNQGVIAPMDSTDAV